MERGRERMRTRWEEEEERGHKCGKPSSLLSFLCWLASNFAAVSESSLDLCVIRPTVEEKIQH